MSIFFTSDTHFYHEKIITLGKGRPFDSIEQMNEILIKNWNKRIAAHDTVYFLGDFYMNGPKKVEIYKELGEQLNGKIHFILGNHDNKKLIEESSRFESVQDYKELKIHKKLIVMMHYPLYSWKWSNKPHSFHIFGHLHNSVDMWPKKCLDVGVDAWSYFPVSLDEFFDKMKNEKRKAEDHHAEKNDYRARIAGFWKKLFSKTFL
jgi:calcineurin-like phosphoesterase family protein